MKFLIGICWIFFMQLLDSVKAGRKTGLRLDSKMNGGSKQLFNSKDNDVMANFYNRTVEPLEEIIKRTISLSKNGIDSAEIEFSQRGKGDTTLDNQELKETLFYMLNAQQQSITEESLYTFAMLFVKDFTICDSDHNNVLTYDEFKSCIKNSTYFSTFIPQMIGFMNKKELQNEEAFYSTLFRILDDKNFKIINFVQYMNLRLYTFAWRYCSVFKPTIEENEFKCIIDITSNYATISRVKSSNLYQFAIELSSGNDQLDFIEFVTFTKSVKLFCSINTKQTEELSKTELTNSINKDMLPPRYSMDVINTFIKLTSQTGKKDSIDMVTFIFYDYILQLLDLEDYTKPTYLSFAEFSNLVDINIMFPKRIKNEVMLIPQYNITISSYKMIMLSTMMYHEKDHFYKTFLETEAKTVLKKSKNNLIYNNYPVITPSSPNRTTEQIYNVTFNMKSTLQKIFRSLDIDQDGFMSFYDFAVFMETAYLYSKSDQFLKGRLPCEFLREKFITWSDYPTVSSKFKESAKRLNMINSETPIDLLTLVQLIRLDDFSFYYVRRHGDVYMNELDIKQILKMINMQYVPEQNLNRCLRGLSKEMLPRFDWECCFLEGIKQNLQYFETLDYYNLSKKNGIGLKSTSFINIDPNYI